MRLPYRFPFIAKMLMFKMRKLNRHFPQDANITILDVGCGNHSSSLTKLFFPNSKYHAIDRDEKYNNNPEDIENIDRFYHKDLRCAEFDDIPDQSYDAIVMSHIIEHLPNGLEVVEKLLPKLKEGGVLYIEFPGMKSTQMNDNLFLLNFYTDPSHVRIYTLEEIYDTLTANGMIRIEGGVKRNYFGYIFIPFRLVSDILRYGRTRCSCLSDVFGFSEYCVFKKPDNTSK